MCLYITLDQVVFLVAAASANTCILSFQLGKRAASAKVLHRRDYALYNFANKRFRFLSLLPD